jgi:hypothetical protein
MRKLKDLTVMYSVKFRGAFFTFAGGKLPTQSMDGRPAESKVVEQRDDRES